jgi:hypothetical protein
MRVSVYSLAKAGVSDELDPNLRYGGARAGRVRRSGSHIGTTQAGTLWARAHGLKHVLAPAVQSPPSDGRQKCFQPDHVVSHELRTTQTQVAQTRILDLRHHLAERSDCSPVAVWVPLHGAVGYWAERWVRSNSCAEARCTASLPWTYEVKDVLSVAFRDTAIEMSVSIHRIPIALRLKGWNHHRTRIGTCGNLESLEMASRAYLNDGRRSSRGATVSPGPLGGTWRLTQMTEVHY